MSESLSHNVTVRRFARFLVVGVINTLFGYAVYALFLWLGLVPQLALILAFIIGVMWNYLTTARLVFRVEGLRRVPYYVGAYLLVYSANALSLRFALAQGLDPFLAQGILTPIFAVMSFCLLSLVFRGVSRPV